MLDVFCAKRLNINLEVALTYEKDPIFERIYTKFFSGKFKILSKKFLQHPSRDFYKYRMHSGSKQGFVNKNQNLHPSIRVKS